MKRPSPMDSKDSREKTGSLLRQVALAMELPFLLVVPVLVGGAIGYFLDDWLHTRPVFLLVLGVLGIVAGIRDVLKRATAEEKRNRD